MRSSLTAALAAALTLTLGGCADSSAPTVDPTTAATSTMESASEAIGAFTLVDGWAKAVEEIGEMQGEMAMGAMTGVFGTLTNTTDSDIHVVGGSSPLAGVVELHETAMVDGTMKMRETEDGFVIPAGGAFVLEPGANHIMLMELNAPIPAGTDVEVVLMTEDGTALTLSVPARTFTGGEEEYVPGDESMEGSSEMTMTPSPTSSS